ncbi:MAG TPA: type IV pilus twitching motility protein PilT [Firmicutes bacterium]|nr:type IV pilus twitching motility protein PilT [Bacillota bacterium]
MNFENVLNPKKEQEKEEKEGSAKKILKIQDLLRIQIEKNASDLHIAVGVPPLLRIHGKLTQLTEYPPIKPEDSRRLISSILSDIQRDEYNKNHQIDFAYELAGQARFRVNAYWERRGESAAFRLIPTEILSIKDLGLPEILESLAFRSRGFVVVTGPTGSGKSTTLAAIIDVVNKKRHDHIITIEDPIEFIHEHKNCLISQREVGAHTNSFFDGLRVALREDPDVILVGELRDYETISLAIRAAETGHLVFATLHTSSAISTIDRIIDVFPMEQQEQIRAQVSDVLVSVICQTLLPKMDGKGRVCAVEIMMANAAIKNLIREEKTHQIISIIQTSKAEGMVLIDQSLMDLLKKGVITGESAYIQAHDKKLFAQFAPESVKRAAALGQL